MAAVASRLLCASRKGVCAVFKDLSHRHNCRIVFLSIIIILTLAWPLPQVNGLASANQSEATADFEPLPNFDARSLRPRRVQPVNVEQKKQQLALVPAARNQVGLSWNDELDTPHHLFSLAAPLTAESTDDPATIAQRFVRNNRALYAINQDELEESRVAARATDERDGLTRLALEQRVNRLRVFDGEMLFILDRQGRVLSTSGSFIPAIARRAPDSQPAFMAEQALHRAAEICGAQLTAPVSARIENLSARERTTFASDEVDSRSEASLVYYPLTRDDVRLAYQVLLYGVPTMIDAYLILIDAKTGEALRRDSLTYAMAAPEGRVFSKENPVVAGNREMISFAGDANASPQGWVSNGRTEGNNATVLFNPELNGGTMIKANADGNFDFPLDLAPTRSPLSSSSASAANLFYWINIAHDRFYALGFNEAARNFQVDNLGKGGAGSDPVRAETLRGAALDPTTTKQLIRNNAYFSSTPDGTPPLLAMLMWDATINNQPASLDSSYDAGVIIHEYTHGVSTRLAGTDNVLGLRSTQGAGMGEGWSDFFAMSFLAGSDAPLDGSFATGSYIAQRARGVRAYPYSTRFDINPMAFGDIRANTEVHAVGTVWCTILWEMRQAFIARYGFDAGHTAAERLVINGLKLTPLTPTFVDARNAILLADKATNNGANQELIWRAFARRGLGHSASTSLSTPIGGYRINAVEAYDIPPEVSAGTLLINDRAPYLAALGETLPLVAVDRDLTGQSSLDVRATNMRTGETATLTLTANAPGKFGGVLRIASAGTDGGAGGGMAAQPGDEIAITYANASNEAGAAETVEIRATAARRVTVYATDFEQDAANWLLQGDWHLTERRAASGAHSLYFAKQKGKHEKKSYTKEGSFGVAYAPEVKLQNLVKPQLEFDYYFSGALTELPDLLTLGARTYPFGSTTTADDPLLTLAFDLQPDAEPAFKPVKIDLQAIGRTRAYVGFTFTASRLETSRKKLEGVYLDNLRITALSTQ
jgi:hypothetical protein